MNTSHIQFVGSIPENYDTHLGPLFFEYYGADLARRLDVPTGGRVLETACGTGISTEHLRGALPDSVEIVATDLNDAMLDYGRAKRSDLANVSFRQADALDLPFEDASFDAVACQFGLMFFPDKAAGMAEALRVLKPGGMLGFNVWDSLDANEIARVAHETIGTFFDDDPPQFLLLPFSYHQIGPIEALLAKAGFDAVTIEAVDTVVERPSARDVATGFVEGNPGIHEINERATAAPDVIAEAVAEAFRGAFGDAPLRASLRAIVATARRPDVADRD